MSEEKLTVSVQFGHGDAYRATLSTELADHLHGTLGSERNISILIDSEERKRDRPVDITISPDHVEELIHRLIKVLRESAEDTRRELKRYWAIEHKKRTGHRHDK